MLVKNLRAYLANVEMTIEDFAKKIDVTSQYVSRIAGGSAKPSRRLARDIKIATGGVIDLSTRQSKHCCNQQEQHSQPE